MVASIWVAVARADPETHVIDVPYDPARPDAPTRAVIRIGLPAAAAPPAEDGAFVVPNPFARARDELVAYQEANALPEAPGRSMPDGPVRPPALSSPPARRCLAPAPSADGEVEGAGLAASAIRATLDAFLPRIVGCIPPGTVGSFAPVASFTVGCDGRVRDVALTTLDGVPPTVAACLAGALRGAPFPAHDRVGGEVFEVPLRFGP